MPKQSNAKAILYQTQGYQSNAQANANQNAGLSFICPSDYQSNRRAIHQMPKLF